MENEDNNKTTISHSHYRTPPPLRITSISEYSSPTHSLSDRKLSSPPEKSPEVSPLCSDHSSLSHGFSSPQDQPPSYSPDRQLQPSPEGPEPVVNKYVRDVPMAATTKVDRVGESVDEKGTGSGIGRRWRPSLSILTRTRRENTVKRVGLGFRVFGFLFCLISFSVMVSDKDKGWALDSFDRYQEFRYCLAVSVIGFVYSGVQALDLTYQLATGKYILRHRLRYYFDFTVDQMLTYLLISASSSAAVRVEDWLSNWGNDKFPEMARASVAVSFLAFVAFAFSSLISGYTLCTSKST